MRQRLLSCWRSNKQESGSSAFTQLLAMDVQRRSNGERVCKPRLDWIRRRFYKNCDFKGGNKLSVVKTIQKCGTSVLIWMCVSLTAAAQTQVCGDVYGYVPEPNSGIGDGCTTGLAGYLFPDIGVFKSTFTPACNRHDTCYTQIGGTYGMCDGQFLDDMRAACDGKFNKWLQPIEYNFCRDTASRYYWGMKAWGETKDPLPRFQSEAMSRMFRFKFDTDYRRCIQTAEGSKLMTPQIMAEIDAAFMNAIGRKPTVFETTSVATMVLPDGRSAIYHDRYNWAANRLPVYAASRAMYPPPTVQWATQKTWEYLRFYVVNPTANTDYRWSVNGYTNAGPELRIPVPEPMYDSTYTFSGALEAMNFGTAEMRNATPISHTTRTPGWCSSGPQYYCR